MKLTHSLLACAASAAALVTVALSVHAPAEAANAPGPLVITGPAPAPAQGGNFGTIKGKLVFGGDAPELPKISANALPFCKDQNLVDRALEVDAKSKGIAHAFVWIEAPKGKNAAAEKALLEKKATVQIDNNKCEFVPRVIMVHKNQKVEFTSSDPVGHNSHYTGFNQSKNVVVPPNGKVSDKLQFEKRPIALTCDIHPWMKGWIKVMDHPFYTVTSEDGSFEIKDVPAGTQNLVIWQEKVGYVTANLAKGQPVTVKAGETTDVGTITLEAARVAKAEADAKGKK